ncbi:MAG: substrate-binding domain-containing protein [Lachnospiraceae bacterium]|nr:substrate-binding domain-containing protein [Lachnospiraceae bacterium]
MKPDEKEKMLFPKNTEGREDNDKQYTLVTVFLVTLTAISVMVMIGSMVYFKKRITGDVEEALTSNRDYDRHYALVVRGGDESYWQTAYESMKNEGELTGVYVDKTGDNLPDDYPEYDLMEIAIASRVDGIIYEADDTVDSIVQINKATAAGIPVVTVRSDAPASARRSFIGVSYYNLGNEYGRLIIKACREIVGESGRTEYDENTGGDWENEGISVLILTDSTMQDTSQNVVITALKETLQKKSEGIPEISVKTAEVDNSGEFTAEESIRDMFLGNRLPDIIVCLNETNTVIVYQTIVEMNKVGEAIILGYDDSEPILNEIEKEVIYATITVDNQQLGQDCVDALNEYIEYKRVSDYYGVDYKIIDRENVSDGSESGAGYEE